MMYINDGDLVSGTIIKQFDLNSAYDFSNSLEDSTDNNYRINFVGFIINSNREMLTVFPKKYKVSLLNDDSKCLFDVINKHRNIKTNLYIGENPDCKFETNYPFASFFNIYDYYIKYGLYLDENKEIKPNVGEKVNWKYTIKKSQKIITNENELAIYPIFYSKNKYYTNFITECMVYAINYTLELFKIFIRLPSINYDITLNFENKNEEVIRRLLEIRGYIFKDIHINLIDNLIQFYSNINRGGNYYLKHYKFSSIWEDMIEKYLNNYFNGINEEGIILGKNNDTKKFSKQVFYPNAANESHNIQPDHYYISSDNQLIFDAKYYRKLTGINYKQLSYHFILQERKDKKDTCKTYSALILPSDKRKQKIHFKLEDDFNCSNLNIIIHEEYFDIKDVCLKYLSSFDNEVK